MLEPYEWKSMVFCEPVRKSPIEELYYKVRCYYNAQTELYDKSLSTVSYILNGEPTPFLMSDERNIAGRYAYKLYQICTNILISETHHPFDYAMWRLADKSCAKEQRWIDEYKRMESNGELDFIKKYIKEEEI